MKFSQYVNEFAQPETPSQIVNDMKHIQSVKAADLPKLAQDTADLLVRHANNNKRQAMKDAFHFVEELIKRFQDEQVPNSKQALAAVEALAKRFGIADEAEDNGEGAEHEAAETPAEEKAEHEGPNAEEKIEPEDEMKFI